MALGTLTPTQLALAKFMSQLSERTYAAGWMANIEYELWDAVVFGKRDGAMWNILTDRDVVTLRLMAISCGGWIYFDDDRAETFLSYDAWMKRYAEHRGN